MLISFVISSVISLLKIELFILNENQLLYLFSMSGQVASGIFALTLTSYIFFADKLKEAGSNSTTYWEASLELRRKFFIDLLHIAFLVILTVCFSTIGILLLNSNCKTLNFCINFSVFLFLLSTISIVFFGIVLLNPDLLDEETLKLGEEAKVSLNLNDDAETVELSQFLREYNLLEDSIFVATENVMTLASEEKISIKHQRSYQKLPIIQSINILRRTGRLSKEVCSEVHELRKYRNSIVHSLDETQIPKSILDRIMEIQGSIS